MKKLVLIGVFISIFACASETPSFTPEELENARNALIQTIEKKIQNCQDQDMMFLCWALEGTLEETKSTDIKNLDPNAPDLFLIHPHGEARQKIKNPQKKILEIAQELRDAEKNKH
ncbi:MAG TPA: hypothetical protein VEK38_04390 [Candidatus Bathyarchaeia archaeon]|nr:hypothetical protein [Candidatus Bathyarchaeia archaeon]